MINIIKRYMNIFNLIWFGLIIVLSIKNFSIIRPYQWFVILSLFILFSLLTFYKYIETSKHYKYLFIIPFLLFLIVIHRYIIPLLIILTIITSYTLIINKILKNKYMILKFNSLVSFLISASLSIALLINISTILLSLAIFNKYTVFLVYVIPIIINGIFIKDIIKIFKNNTINVKLESLTSSFRKSNLSIKYFAIIILFFIFLTSIYSLAPEIMFDANKTHLSMVDTYSRKGFLDYSIDRTAFYMPQSMIMIFTLFFAWFGEIGAKFINFVLFILSMATVVVINRRFYSNKSAMFSILIFSTIPLIIYETSTANIDTGLLFFELISLYILLEVINAKETTRKFLLILAGVFTGTALGIKYLALYTVISFVISYLISKKDTIIQKFKDIILFCLVSLVFGGFWYIRSFVLTGNPIFPFYNYIFKSNLWKINNEHMNLSMFGLKTSFLNFFLVPIKTVFNSSIFWEAPNGALGISFIICLLIVLYWLLKNFRKISRETTFLLSNLLIIYFFWFTSAQYLRYDILVYPILSIIIGISLSSYYKNNQFNQKTVIILVTLTLLSSLIILPSIYWNIKGGIPLNVVANLEKKEDYLKQNLSGYDIYNYINKNIRNTDRILSIGNLQYRYRMKPDVLLYFDYPLSLDFNADKKINSLDFFKKYNISYVIISNDKKLDSYFTEDFIEKYLQIVYASEGNYLYQVMSEKKVNAPSSNLLKNASFEVVDNTGPEFWSITSKNQLVNNSKNAFKGNRYVRASVDKPIIQRVKVQPNHIYQLSFYSKIEIKNEDLTRLQINWMDNSQFISSSINVVKSTSAWKKYELIVSAPSNVNYALIYINSHQNYFIDFDNVNFTELH